jgi:hypothetical protein
MSYRHSAAGGFARTTDSCISVSGRTDSLNSVLGTAAIGVKPTPSRPRLPLWVESTHCCIDSPTEGMDTLREAVRHSEFDLLRQRQSIIDLDPEIPNRALNLRMSEKQLDRP